MAKMTFNELLDAYADSCRQNAALARRLAKAFRARGDELSAIALENIADLCFDRGEISLGRKDNDSKPGLDRPKGGSGGATRSALGSLGRKPGDTFTGSNESAVGAGW